jgi:hypothetical protein
VSTLPDDAPQKAKDKLKEYKADKIETLYIATVTWVAWWVCTKGDGIPVKPPANPGSGASTWVGGSEKKFPCPHPFFSGKGDASIKFVQSELHPATADHFATEKAAAEKAVPEEAEKKTKAEVEEAIKKLPQCPPDCPQASPLSIQIGPSGKKDASHAGGPAGSGDETCDIEFWYYWSVERNCAAGH